MYTLVCDTGVKNFCYVVFKNKDVIEFDVLNVKTGNALYNLLNTLSKNYDFNKIIVERAYSRNSKGLAYVTIINIFFKCLADHKNVTVDIIIDHAGAKFKRLNIDIADTSTRERKKKSIEIGKGLMFSEKKLTLSHQSDLKYQTLKKLDDFYDCVLMYYTLTFL